ncbi:MAG: cob(I)yrinic acid a,c-diamide adenosyltransferase [Syntrophales bacterium]|nr:cob(I)yrinic acid a,c-diamide adenosyltransferase [Syntrophales bacterium]
MEDPIAETLARFNRGLVLVYTGDGKGKTTAAIGQALRSVGHGSRVLIIQFMKGKKYGEVLASEKYLAGMLTMVQCGLDSFVMKNDPAPVDIELARQGLALAKKAVASGDYQMVVLDEINVALDFKLVELEDVIEIIKTKPVSLDLVLTGRYAPADVIELADMVSEVREIKHHYAQGIKERAGIEY